MNMLQKSAVSLFVMICFCCVPVTAWASSTKDLKKTTETATEKTKKAVETEKTKKTAAVDKTKKTAEAKVKKAAPVDLNTATVEELKTLNGIGDKKAKAIVDYRKKNGFFKTPEDITKVSGIGESTFKKNKSLLIVTPQSAAKKTKSKKK